MPSRIEDIEAKLKEEGQLLEKECWVLIDALKTAREALEKIKTSGCDFEKFPCRACDAKTALDQIESILKEKLE